MIMNLNKDWWIKFIENRDEQDIIDCIFDFEISRLEMYELLKEHFNL